MKYQITIKRLKEATETDKYPTHTEVYSRLVSAVDIASISEIVERAERQATEPRFVVPAGCLSELKEPTK